MSEPAADKPTLGQVSVNRDVFDLDLRINDGYQAYSAELLLSLSGIFCINVLVVALVTTRR